MKKPALFIWFAAILAIGVDGALAGDEPGPHFTMENEPSGEPYDWQTTRLPEKPWKRPYNEIITTKLLLCKRDRDGGMGEILFTFEQALEVIRRVHRITPELDKVIYLVGWQYNGHDSKYPAWHQVNRALKRPQDKDALTSLRWLFKEAKDKYRTYLSFHINMLDAYPDSPLWNTYVENDIIAKRKDGSIRWSVEWDGMRAATISYVQEWKLGYAQKRIDDLVEMFPELKETGSIHIDAFQVHDKANPAVSEVLDHTLEDEARTMRKIYRYWRDKHGIDVTAEGTTHKRNYTTIVDGKRTGVQDDFVGLQPFAWIFQKGKGPTAIDINDLYPSNLYTRTLLPLAPCFNENLLNKNTKGQRALNVHRSWRQVRRKFYTWTVPDYLFFQQSAKGQDIRPFKGDRDLRTYCLPIAWRKDKSVAVWVGEDLEKLSNGEEGKKFTLPESWRGIDSAKVFDVNTDLNGDGWNEEGEVDIVDGTVELVLRKRDGRVLRPIE